MKRQSIQLENKDDAYGSHVEKHSSKRTRCPYSNDGITLGRECTTNSQGMDCNKTVIQGYVTASEATSPNRNILRYDLGSLFTPCIPFPNCKSLIGTDNMLDCQSQVNSVTNNSENFEPHEIQKGKSKFKEMWLIFH
jgi:hypothetical protein